MRSKKAPLTRGAFSLCFHRFKTGAVTGNHLPDVLAQKVSSCVVFLTVKGVQNLPVGGIVATGNGYIVTGLINAKLYLI